MDLDGYVIIFAQTSDHKIKLFGCPADRADMETSDEIVEVNGKCVRNCPKEFLTRYIKQCIKTRTVNLRVKRRKQKKRKGTQEIPADSSVPQGAAEQSGCAIEKVHDAYVIAVEDEAKKRLDQFTTGQKVHAVDMTQVPTAATASNNSSINDNSNGSAKTGKLSQGKSKSGKTVERQQQLPQPNQEEEYTVQDNPLYQTTSFTKQTVPMPGEKKKKTSHGHSSPHGGSATNGGSREDSGEWLEMNGVSDKEVGKKGKGKRTSRGGSSSDTPIINDYLANGSLTMSSNDGYSSHPGGFRNGGHHNYEMSQDSSFDYELDDPGPHREMAIDVPENFVASVKSPPRYPPPHSASSTPRSAASPAKTNNKEHKGDKSQSQTSLNSASSASKQQHYPPQHHIQPTPQELERLHRHQEELKKRREEESRQQAEQEFLRASLRGSQKLQALENKRPVGPLPSGFVNTAFDDEDDDDDDGIDDSEGKSHSRQLSEDMLDERYLKKNVGVEDLFSSLHHVKSRLTSPEDQKYISYLRSLFQNDQFQQAVNLHNQMVEITSRSPPPKPITEDAAEQNAEVHHHIAHAPHNAQAKELLTLINKTHFKNLLEAHDTVSQQALQAAEEADLHGEPIDYPLVQYGEDSVKIIHLEKTNEHLGATVKNEGESVIIGRIVKGGAAEKSGLLHEGDEILEVNGIDMRGKNINDVSEMLANMTGTITFMIIPGHSPSTDNMQRPNKVMHLRALFTYDPEDDPYIPCRELGIGFLRGDILHAIALDDPNWWQAFREGEEEDQSLAGLIPSKSFTEQREAMKNSLENKENKKKARVCACGRKERNKKKKKKKVLYSGSSEDSEEILTYEEIARYYPQPNRKRPIVLIGPNNVGRNELQQRLIESDPDRFATPLPYTTRPARPNEAHHSSYHHVTREDFEAMIQDNRFVEFGEHMKNLYGTSFDGVREIIAEGKVCVLVLEPETLKIIRASDLKPYIIFVCPPNLEKLRQLQNQLSSPLSGEVKKGRDVLTVDDQLREIIDRAREIEDLYGHLFDFVMVNSDLERAFPELLEEINRIEMEPQWVPASWIDSL